MPPLTTANRALARHIVRDCVFGLVTFFLVLAGAAWTAERASLGLIPAIGEPSAVERSAPASSLQEVTRDAFVLGQPRAMVAELPPPQAHTSSSVLEATSRRTAIIILAAAFSAIVAFNLWFLRHLGRVYASPRLGAWGRG